MVPNKASPASAAERMPPMLRSIQASLPPAK
jgi:hypothetical protein